MKRATAIVLALALLLSFAVSVMAHEDPAGEVVIDGILAGEDYEFERPTVIVIEEPVGPMFFMPEEIRYFERDGQFFIAIKDWAENIGFYTQWLDELDAVLVYGGDSELGVVVYTVGTPNAFVEDGVTWVDPNLLSTISMALFPPRFPMFDFDDERIDRLNSHVWGELLAVPARDAMFSLDMGYGVIAAGYIYHLSQNLPMRTPFSYTELAAAMWIVEELLAMGHSPENIQVQEFCYWEINEYRIGMWGGGMSWWSAMHMLGDQDIDLLRRDRVSQNIVLTIPGQSQRTIIVGAHYDSPPDPGTSDNASGVGLLMESAKRMLEYDNYYTISYVFFGAEELGLLGAAWNLHLMTEAERDNVVMMVNADVLLEGPVLIYGAAAQPSGENIDREAFMLQMETMMLTQMEQLIDSPFIEQEMTWLGVDTIEEAIEIMMLQVEWQLASFEIMPDALFERQARSMRLGWDITPVAQQVSEIAASLSQTSDFSLRSIPRAVAMPTDSLIFLDAGFTIVNLTGAEYRENVSDELAAQLYRLGEGFPEYGLTVTILHSPLDCYYVIQELWPGMIYDNMYAFVTFLNAILSARFTG